MKKIVFFIMILAIASCSSNNGEDALREEITKKKGEIAKLNGEIHDLQKQLAEITTSTDIYKVPVEVKEMLPETFNHYFEASGSVEAVNEAFISPETSGQIKDILVKEGVVVSKGQLLARLNNDITANTIKEVESSLSYAQTVFEKQERLWKKGIGSEIEYLNAKNNVQSLEAKLETLRSQQEMSFIRSPVDGIVDKIYSKEGELSMPGMQLMQIVNLDELFVNADVAENYLSSISEGDPVVLTFPVYPDMEIVVPVHKTGNVINPQNRTFSIRLKLRNDGKKLKPNILAVVKINDFSSDSALLVPSNIIKQDMNGQYLYTLSKSGNNQHARKVYISTGKSYKNKTMVTDGLKPGDMVIINGYNQVTDGTEIMLNG